MQDIFCSTTTGISDVTSQTLRHALTGGEGYLLSLPIYSLLKRNCQFKTNSNFLLFCSVLLTAFLGLLVRTFFPAFRSKPKCFGDFCCYLFIEVEIKAWNICMLCFEKSVFLCLVLFTGHSTYLVACQSFCNLQCSCLCAVVVMGKCTSAYLWLKLFKVHVGGLADLTVGGKADENNFKFVESCVTVSDLKPLILS